MRTYIFKQIVVLSVLITALSASCSKTEYEATKLPYNEITKFAISGFVDGDSVIGVLSNKEILIYWDQSVALPQTIRPTISVSKGASVLPASGESVPLDATTKFVVTAEDGTIQDYTVRFILQQPDPIVLSVNNTNLQWTNTAIISITGQYFLAGGPPSDIRVFARRLRDGVEFDLNIDHKYTNSVTLRAELPPFTAEADTGRHDIFLKVGQKTIEAAKVRIKAPALAPNFFSFLNEPTNISGDEELSIRIDDKMNGEILKFYSNRFSEIWFNLEQKNTNSYKQLKINKVTVEGNIIKFKVPSDLNDLTGYKLSSIWFRIKDASHWEGFETFLYDLGTKNITIQ
ncbi:MAG: hypothetical protein LBE37_08920 [Sphingobacterium sp.]|jgi:hypothetical protein|nr:hypothetical protein [Sphingobacterium sp.]